MDTHTVPVAERVLYTESHRAVVPLSSRYPKGHRIAPHWHARAQLVYASRGTLTVRTERRAWIVPPSRALWVPAQTVHEVQMFGEVEMRSLYVQTASAGGMPVSCAVLDVTPLLRELVLRASELPSEYDEAGDDGLVIQLLIAEMRRVPRCALELPLPESADLRALCERIIAEPAAGGADRDHEVDTRMSSRTLYRRFRKETGISFARWKQQARVLEAIKRLAEGSPVTAVAIDLGYESASAFSTMFRRSLGVPPRAFFLPGAAAQWRRA
jgi:AraC-like DNA-binding protein/quercetin dioxygenase-like cupin family protein